MLEWFSSFIVELLKLSREYILLYSLPTNPLTGIIYTGIAYYGYFKLKKRVDLDLSKFYNKILVFLYSVSLLGFINFCLENVWLTSFFVKYTFLNDGWLDHIYFNIPSGWFVNYLRNFVFMIVLYMISSENIKHLNLNKKTVVGFFALSVYIIAFFMLSPNYAYIDWTYAIAHNYPNSAIITSFMLSMFGKPLLFYIFYSLFLPKQRITEKSLTLDVGCGAHPRGTVNVDLLVPNSDRHVIDVHSIPNLIVADAHYLPFKDKVFDKTLTYHMMEHIQGGLIVYDEFARVTANSIEVRVPWWIWEKVMNKVMFWTKNEAFRKEHHLHQYLRNEFQELLQTVFNDASIQVNYGYLSFLHGIKQQEIKRDWHIPFPLPFELVAHIDLEGSY